MDANSTVASATAATASGMIFLDIPVLKTRLGVDKIDIVRSPKTGKLFGSTVKGSIKVQQDLDGTKSIKFMYESEEKFNEGCIVNTTPTTPPIMVL